MAAGSIVVDLLMKTGSFETDTARAAKSLKKLQREAEAIGKAFGVAIVGAAGTLAYLVKSTLDANDHLAKLAQKTGIAADTLGGIGYAAQLAGGDLDSAGLAAGKLNKSLAEAAAGTREAQEAFDAMGISVKDAAGNTKNADVALAEIADKFATYADGPEKAALALRIFGKAGQDMIPLLNGGGDALRQQIEDFKRYSGFTEESAKQAEVFNDTVSRLHLLMGAFAQDLTTAMLPALQALADLFVKNREEAGGYQGIAERLADSFKALAVFVAYVGTTFAETGNQIGAFFAKASALARLDFKGFSLIGAEASADLDKTRRNFQAFYDAIYAGRKKVEGPIPGAAATPRAAPRLPGDPTRGGGADAAAARQRTRDAEFAARQLVKIEEQAAEDAADAWKFWEQQQLDLSKARADAEKEQWRQVFDFIDQQQEDAIEEGKAFLKESASDLDNFAKNAAENIQRSFGDSIQAAMEGNWKSIGDGFTSMLNRIVAEAASAQITRALFGSDSQGSVTGTGGIGGDVLKWFGGLLGFAGGGSPPVGRPSIVGERGPELFVPRTAGTILPAPQTAAVLAGRTGGQTLNITVAPPAGMDARTSAQFARDAARQISLAVARGAA